MKHKSGKIFFFSVHTPTSFRFNPNLLPLFTPTSFRLTPTFFRFNPNFLPLSKFN